MNELYPVEARFTRRANQDLLSVNAHTAGVFLNHAAQDFHQRGFARSVLSYERDHFCRINFQINIVECDYAWESLADSLHLQHGRRV